MTIAVLADLHGSATHFTAAAGDIKAADILVLAGDLTNFGGRREAQSIVEEASALNPRVLAVCGNCDLPEVDEYLDEIGINLDGRSRTLGGLTFAGLGASLSGPAFTPFTRSEEELGERLRSAAEGLSGPFVLVSHQPPFGTAADVIQSGRHVGSSRVREFLAERQPIACLCGHIHESEGVDTLGVTRIVNPGPFLSGRYALLSVGEDGSVAVEMRRA